MENEIEKNGNPPKQEYLKALCSHCQSPISIELPPVLFTNNPLVSIITIPHERGVFCTCGAYYTIFVPEQQLGAIFRETQPPAGKILIPQGKIM